MAKIKALVQWFMELELVAHGHWCIFNFNTDDHPTYRRDSKREACPTKGYRWDCKGVFCSGVERKNCPACDEWDRVNRDKLPSLAKGANA
jgi:hypothetical protein